MASLDLADYQMTDRMSLRSKLALNAMHSIKVNLYTMYCPRSVSRAAII